MNTRASGPAAPPPFAYPDVKPLAEPPTWLPWAMLGLAWCVYAYFGIIGASLAPLLTRVQADLGISYSQAGVLLGAWPLVFMVMAYPAGQLNDRLGLKRTLLMGLAVITLSAFLRSRADSFELMFVAVALFGLGGPTVSTGLPKIVAQWFSGPARIRASGIYVTGATTGSALALATTNSIVLPLVGSWQGVYLAYSAIGLLVFAGWALFGRNGPGTTAAQRATDVGGIPARAVLRMGAVWVVVIVGFTTFALGHGFSNWLPAILEARAFSREQAGYLASIRTVLQIAGSIAITSLATRLGRRKPLVLVLLAFAASTLIGMTFLSGPPLVAVIFLEGVFAGALFPLLMSILMDLPQIGPGGVGTAAGLYYTVGEAGGFVAPAVVGLLWDATGTFTAGILLLAGIAVAGMGFASYIRETAPRDRDIAAVSHTA